jgi:hypothetical protein
MDASVAVNIVATKGLVHNIVFAKKTLSGD